MMIAKIITIIVVIIFFITGIITTVSISTNAEPIKYSMYNTLDCDGNDDYPPYIDDSLLPITELLNTYSPETARFCIDLVSRIELNKPIVPTLLKNSEFLSVMDKEHIFSVVWYSNDIIWVAFRGSWNLTEWINNSKIQQISYDHGTSEFKNLPSFMENNHDIMLHKGFVTIYNQLKEGIISSINELGGKNKHICVTGYSLGGAVANILGLDLHTMGYDTQIYSFGSPRIGNCEFSDTVARSGLQHYRIVNTEDIIPQMPLPVSPNFLNHSKPYFYTHNGIERKFTNCNKSNFANHATRTYVNNINNV
jgi:hypothetical protein